MIAVNKTEVIVGYTKRKFDSVGCNLTHLEPVMDSFG